jgi:hypothetical protein
MKRALGHDHDLEIAIVAASGAVFQRHIGIGLDQITWPSAASAIAIQEEVAQTLSREFGITRFDVGNFTDDRVLIYPKPPQRRIARSQLHCAMRNDGLASFGLG